MTSLVSSRKGAVPAEITDKLTDTFRTSSSSNTEANAKIVKSSASSVLESTRTQDRQVLRKATIQATFKDLYEGEWDVMAMRSLNSSIVIPDLSEVRSILGSSEISARRVPQWVVGSEQLTRGRLAEVEVELQADQVFQVSAFVSSFLDMFASGSELAGQIDREESEGVREFNSILEKLLVGLIPIKCRLVDYEALEEGGKEYLIHRRLLEALPAAERPPTRSAYLVGVTEQDLFWKDIRRVLFSRKRVKVLCRLNNVGISSSWTAVKLADMIGSIVPGFAHQFTSFVSDVLGAMISGSSNQEPQEVARVAALEIYGNLLAQEGEITLTDSDRAELTRLAGENAHLLASSIPDSRHAFRRISRYFTETYSLTVGSDRAHDLRMLARSQAGLIGNVSVQPIISSSLRSPQIEDERFLDAEVIAIYW
ncbi:DUF6414 family protein [Streptomyces griseoaurantiacus]|uniref:DUF6414 family protein n=1 Tax=Streptomyces griseoaurantiacus TaxID=68213 RepID=UPI003244581E